MRTRWTGIRIARLAVLAGLLVNCQTQPPSKQDSNETQRGPTGSLESGPIRHEELTPEQIQRLRKIHDTLNEVDPSDFDKMVEDFKRDLHPDREILIWEQIVAAYQSYCSTRRLTLPAKQDVLRILLARSDMPEEEALKGLPLSVLTVAEAKTVMSYYKAPALPIEVERPR
jgi:hypothetical protein